MQQTPDFYDILADFIPPEYYLAKRNPEQWTAKYWKKTKNAQEMDSKKKMKKAERKKAKFDPDNIDTTTQRQRSEANPDIVARPKSDASSIPFQKKRKLTNTELIQPQASKKSKHDEQKSANSNKFETQGIIHSKFELVKPKKKSNNPLKALQKIQSEKVKLSKKLEKQPEKAEEIASDKIWKNAIARAKGEKIKDNEAMLQQSVNKLQKAKAKRIEKWSERKSETEKGISDRAAKRQAALDKRIQQKKDRKLSKKQGNKGKPKDRSKEKSKKKGNTPKKAGRPGFEGASLKGFKK